MKRYNSRAPTKEYFCVMCFILFFSILEGCQPEYEYNASDIDKSWIGNQIASPFAGDISDVTLSSITTQHCQAIKSYEPKIRPTLADIINAKIKGKNPSEKDLSALGFTCKNLLCHYSAKTWSIYNGNPGSKNNGKKLYHFIDVCIDLKLRPAAAVVSGFSSIDPSKQYSLR